MNILVINSGSSTLKFDLVEAYTARRAHGSSGDDEGPAFRKLAHGLVDRIGDEASYDFRTSADVSEQGTAAVVDHRDAVIRVLTWLSFVSGARVQAVGHRIVHGGSRFAAPTLIDDTMLSELESLNEMAPLHNPAAVQGIRAARGVLGPKVPMVAVFDTAFHRSLPQHAAAYALPQDLVGRHHIRRYGFHGIAHEYMLKRYAEITSNPAQNATIITLQLGNGCSVTAIRNGESVDTSMGFTPLEGLVMGTRSGDLDPSIVSYLAEREGVDAAEVERWLNERSGLLGLSGRSSDMRDLLAAKGQDERAALAVEVFCYRARKYLGAYLAVLGGAEAIVFGGGIGENAPYIRARITEGMAWCGLRLDPQRNAATVGVEGRISADESAIHAYVIPVDESLLIAQYAYEIARQDS
jgi:acetate kinase